MPYYVIDRLLPNSPAGTVTSVTIDFPTYNITALNDRYVQWTTAASNATASWTTPTVTMRTVYTGNFTASNCETCSDWNVYPNTKGSWVRWGTGDTCTYNYSCTYDYAEAVKSPADRIREVLRKRQFPGVIISNSKPMGHAADNREMRARETLCRVIGEEKYNRFLKQGWVSVKARSGLVYRIYPGHGITEVYDKGVMKERLCVVLSGNFPPTDSVIIRYLLILNNEQMFRGKAVKHSVPGGQYQRVQMQPEERSIIEIARDIRKAKSVVRKVG